MTKSNFAEAFSYGEKRRHAGITPRAEHMTVDFLSPEETSLNDQASLTFRARVPYDQFMRLSKNPVMIRFKIRYPNPDVKTANDASEEDKAAKWWCMSSADKPKVYLDPLLDFATFFSKVDLNIDSKELQYASSSDQSHAAIFSYFSRCLLSDEERNDLYYKEHMIKSTVDRNFTLPTAPLLKAMEDTDFGSQLKGSFRVINASPESVFALGYPNNGYLSKLLKSPLDLQYPFFPPGSEVIFTLHRNQSHPGAFLHTDISDTNYFTGKDAEGTSTADLPLWDVVLDDVCLVTESVKLEHAPTQAAIRGLSKSVLKFPFDYSSLQVAMLEAGRSRTSTKFLIDESTKLIVLGFLEEFQYQWTGSSKKFQSMMTKFPVSLESIEFQMNKEHLCFSQPLSDLSSTSLYSSMSARLYYNYLRDKGLFNEEYEDLFPRAADAINYRQIFILDCTTLRVAASSSLDVDCTWSGQSPAKMRVACMSVREAMYARDSKKEWTFSILK